MHMKPEISLESHYTASSPTLALQIIPPLHVSKEHSIALESTMQSLVLDRQHPVALELAGTPDRRSFIIRATTQAALDHAETLLRAQYPQSDIHPLNEHDDPFHLEADETVTAVELVAGAAAYLPLRTWKESQEEGNDPLLGLLAALSRLPDHMRVITQLALIPEVSNWSRWNLRRAVENPLEPQARAKEQQRMVSLFSDNSSAIVALNVGIVTGLMYITRTWFPSGMWKALSEIITGRGSHVTAVQSTQLMEYFGSILVLEALMVGLFMLWRFLFYHRTLYDPRVVSQKVSRFAYRTRLRLYVIGPKTAWQGQQTSMLARFSAERAHTQTRKDLLLRIVAAYRQFHMANGAFFIPKYLSHTEATHLLHTNTMHAGQGWQAGLRRSHHIISVDSLASLWHMPHPSVLPELALVEHRRSRTLLIPPDVTRLSQGFTPVGYSDHAGYHLPFALTPEFFTFHTLIGGKAGEGKSTFIQHISREAMKLGGLVLIDPFGDLCEDVLQLVPPERAEDVVFIDLSDTTASVGLNPLDVTLGRGRDKFIADLLKMLAQIWVSSWGAKMENAFEMSLRTLFEANKILVDQDAQQGPGLQYTLLDVLPLLTNANFCHTLLQQIQDDYLHRWWREYYEPLSMVQQRDVINPIASKVAKFESMVARRILGQSVSTLNFSQMIEERKIILFKLAKGIVGSEVSSMIGATLLGLIQSTLAEQGRPGQAVTTRLPIILDEFQRVAGADYRSLSELHKYGATFFLSTQSLEYLQKLNPLLLPTIQANVRQTITFNVSAQDASLFARELGVDQDDIIHLDINTCYISMPAGGRRQPTFSLKLNAPVPESPDLAESIRTRCRVRYTCPVAEVDERLSESMLRSIRMTPQQNAPQPLTIPPGEPEQMLPLPPLTLSVPVESNFDPSAPTSPLEPLPEEATREGAEYRAQRARLAAAREIVPEHNNAIPQTERARLASRRDTEYRSREGEWSNQEDSYRMAKEPQGLQDPLKRALQGSQDPLKRAPQGSQDPFALQGDLSDELRDELELMQINAYNVADEDEDEDEDGAGQTEDELLRKYYRKHNRAGQSQPF